MTDPIRAAVNRLVTDEEAKTYLDHPITDREREDVLALVRWFRQRYPTPIERLAYVRQAYARWTRSVLVGRPSPPD